VPWRRRVNLFSIFEIFDEFLTPTCRGAQYEQASASPSFAGRRRQSIYDIVARRVSLALVADPEKKGTDTSAISLDKKLMRLDGVRKTLVAERAGASPACKIWASRGGSGSG
jgi:hypothetical protein